MNQNDDWDDKHDDNDAQKTDAIADDPALLLSVSSKRARRASLILHPTTSFPPSQPRNSSWFFSVVPLSFQTLDLLSSQIAWAELLVAHVGPVHSWERHWEEYSGVEYNVPFHEESCRNNCIYNSPLHSCSCDIVQPASVHPRWCGVNPAHLCWAHITSTDQSRSAISVSPHFLAGTF